MASETAMVTKVESGSAMTIGSTTAQVVPVTRLGTLKSSRQRPSAADSFSWKSRTQVAHAPVPVSIPAITPTLVARFQKSAETYAGRNAAAHIPKKSAVAIATMPGASENASTSVTTNATRIPIFASGMVRSSCRPRAIACW